MKPWTNDLEDQFQQQMKPEKRSREVMTDDEFIASEEIKSAWSRLCINPQSPTAAEGLRYWNDVYCDARDHHAES